MGRHGSQDGAVDPDNEEPHFGPDAMEPCWLSLGGGIAHQVREVEILEHRKRHVVNYERRGKPI